MAGWYQFFLSKAVPSGAIDSSAGIAFSTTGALVGRGLIESTTTVIAFGSTGDVFSAGTLHGPVVIAFAGSGDILGRAAIVGSSTVSLLTDGTLSAEGEIGGESIITFTSSGTLSSIAGIGSTATIAFGSSGDLTAFTLAMRRTKTVRTILNVSSGQTIRVRARRLQGSDVYTVADASGISITIKAPGGTP